MVKYLAILFIFLTSPNLGTSQMKIELVGGLTSHKFMSTDIPIRWGTEYRLKLGNTIGAVYSIKNSRLGLLYSFERHHYHGTHFSAGDGGRELFTRRAHFLNAIYLYRFGSILKKRLNIMLGGKFSFLLKDKYDGYRLSRGYYGTRFTNYTEDGFYEQRELNTGPILNIEYLLKKKISGIKSIALFSSYNILEDFDSLISARSFNSGIIIGVDISNN